MVDCGPRFAILYWTVYYQCKISVSGKSEPIILKKLDLFSWKFHEIHTQRSLVMRAQKLLYVFARRYQMISACMTVSVRELRTAVREWACWVITYKQYKPETNILRKIAIFYYMMSRLGVIYKCIKIDLPLVVYTFGQCQFNMIDVHNRIKGSYISAHF